jgi:putative endonuclease
MKKKNPKKKIVKVAIATPAEKVLIKPATKAVGNLGEGIVANYLRRRGHTIVARNYTKPWGELDIVSKRKGKIFVSEVKTVSQKPIEYRPEELMHVHKVRRLFRTTMSYLMEKEIDEETPWQLDGFVVVLKKNATGKVIGGTLKRLPNIIGG